MIDFGDSLSDKITAIIDDGLQGKQKKEKARDYLGASLIGDECERKLEYTATGLEQEPFTGKTLRIFDRGHIGEDMAIRWLRAGGFDLRGGQTRIEFLKDSALPVAGHCDGILYANEVFEKLDWEWPALLWENKCLGLKSWKKIFKSGLKDFSQTYWAQIQLYMHGLELPACLFTCVNMDTMELYFEVVKYEADQADYFLDRTKRIIDTTLYNLQNETGDHLPRIANEPGYFKCNWCNFKKECWGDFAS